MPDLRAWDLPVDFAEHQRKLTTLVLPSKATRFDWLSDGLQHLAAPGSAATIVRGFPQHLQSLDLSYSNVSFLAGLPEGLKDLDIRFTNLTTLPDLPSGLTRLALGGDKISTYQGIPADLREMVLEEAPQLTDLYRLPRKLESLTLIGTSFKDLRGLPPRLKELTLKWTGVKTLVDLPDSIRALVLEGNPQLEIGNHLPSFLTVLTAKGTAVPFLYPYPPSFLLEPSYLLELEIDFDSEDPRIPKFPPGLRTLRLHSVGAGPASNTIDLEKLPSRLENLGLQGFSLPGLTALPPQWASLGHLDLSWTGLTQLPPLPSSLESLDLSATDIIDLTHLPKNLSTLRFRRSRATELQGLPDSLVELDLADSKGLNRIRDRLPKLQRLNLHGTAFVDIAQLPRDIRVLDISETGIGSLQGAPPKLEDLTVCSGQIISLADLPKSVRALRFVRPVEPEH